MNAPGRRIGRTGVLFRGPRDCGSVALTFDDGPHPAITPALLEVLERHAARATFFLVGRRAATWPHLARQIAEAGHAIGSHGFAHEGTWWRSATWLDRDLERAEEAFGDLLASPRVFRPPHGLLSPSWYLASRRRGYRPVLWSVASRDWRINDAGRVSARVVKRLRPGSIVLFHECRARTGEGFFHTPTALEVCLAAMRDRGLSAAAVTDYLRTDR